MTEEELVLEGKYYRDERRYEEAYRYFLEAALMDNPEALINLGVLYLYGEGVETNIDKAFHYFRMAYDLSRNMSPFYYFAEEDARKELLFNDHTKKLYTDYIEYMIEREEWDTLIIQGKEYEAGGAYPCDPQRMIQCYEEAIRHGIMFGYDCLGEAYFLGTNVEQDYEKAYHYFTQYEGNQSFVKPYYLGRMYEEGLYVNKDLDCAIMEYESVLSAPIPGKSGDMFYIKAGERMNLIKKRKAKSLEA